VNGRELYQTIYEGWKPDRLPIQGLWPWEETLERWHAEGLEPGRDPHEVLGLVGDDVLPLPLDLTMVPRFPIRVLEKDERHVTLVDEFGVTKKLLRHDFDATSGKMTNAGLASSMSLWLDFPVKDLATWKTTCEERFQPTLMGRVPESWDEHKSEFMRLSETRWVSYFCFPFLGFFGPLRRLMGLERLVLAMAGDDPDLIDTMVAGLADFWLAAFDQMLADVRLDEVTFFEDIASSRAPLISPDMFQRFLAPGYRKVIGGLREMGVQHFFIDSDGDIRPLIPDFLACGITGVGPIEVNAGMNVAQLRSDFHALILNGGIDKRALARGPAAIEAELARYFAVAWRAGRCTPRLDHGAPPDVSWSNAMYFARRYLEYCRAQPARIDTPRPWSGFLADRMGSFYGDPQ
jgi:hypothetical protein